MSRLERLNLRGSTIDELKIWQQMHAFYNIEKFNYAKEKDHIFYDSHDEATFYLTLNIRKNLAKYMRLTIEKNRRLVQ